MCVAASCSWATMFVLLLARSDMPRVSYVGCRGGRSRGVAQKEGRMAALRKRKEDVGLAWSS